MKSNTPETDVAAYGQYHGVSADFARKLERERDEAQIKCAGWQHKTQELTQERDQLRRACDELASIIIFSGIHSPQKARAINNYNALPHVKAKGNKK